MSSSTSDAIAGDLHSSVMYAPLSVEPAYPAEELQTAGEDFFCDECHHGDPPNNSNLHQGTQSQLSAAVNLAKCICGAGSFALPHVFLEQGVLGGTLAITLCGVLAAYTMQSLLHSKLQVSALYHSVLLPSSSSAADNSSSNNNRHCPSCNNASPPLPLEVSSYVELAEHALGPNAAKLVFALTLSACMGVCSTYLVFIGQTLESLSCDTTSSNLIRQWFPNVSARTWEVGTSLVLLPLSLLRSYAMFALTSTIGVLAVLGGIVVTMASGIFVEPGGGMRVALQAVASCRMWPESFGAAFGGSFGTIAYLFCINFLTFPIINSMEKPKEEYAGAVHVAIAGVWLVNVLFAILCLGFYGDQTQDLVLGNLQNGPYLSALKLLLCVDLLFTFPIVFSGGRQILENAILGPEDSATTAITTSNHDSAYSNTNTRRSSLYLVIARTTLVIVTITACLGLAQIGGFGAVANLVGGVAQGTLAFVMPPAIAIALTRQTTNHSGEWIGKETIGQLLLGAFGVLVVSSVTYFTAVDILS